MTLCVDTQCNTAFLTKNCGCGCTHSTQTNATPDLTFPFSGEALSHFFLTFFMTCPTSSVNVVSVPSQGLHKVFKTKGALIKSEFYCSNLNMFQLAKPQKVGVPWHPWDPCLRRPCTSLDYLINVGYGIHFL